MSSGMILAVSGGAALRARRAPGQGRLQGGAVRGEKSHPARSQDFGILTLNPGMFGGPSPGYGKGVSLAFLSSRFGFAIALCSAGGSGRSQPAA